MIKDSINSAPKIELLLISFLLFTIFSGAIRKWLITIDQVEKIVLFVQMLSPLGLLIYTGYFGNQKYDSGKTILKIYIFFLIIVALNPLNATIFHGMIGLIIHTGFWIIILVYFSFPHYYQLENYLWLFIGLGIMEMVLGSVQAVSAPDSWINSYAIQTEDAYGVAKVSGAVRATGTFSYIAGYSSFFFFFLFLNCFVIKTAKNNLLKIAVTLIGVYGSLLSGSRGLVAFYLVILVAFLIFEISLKKTIQTLALGLIILISFVIVNNTLGDILHIQSKFDKALENFTDRFEANQEESEGRLFKDIDAVFTKDFNYRLTGIGLGSTYQGANSLFGKNPLLNNIYYEGELFRLMIEGGILFVFSKIFLLAYILKRLRFSYPFKVCLFVIILLYIATGFIIYNGIFFSFGLILLDRAYQEKYENNYLPLRETIRS